MNGLRTARALVAALGIALSVPAVAADGAGNSGEADYSGDYVMTGQGFGAQDSVYHGTCSLTRAGPGYDVSCFNSDTRHTYTGRGLSAGVHLAVFIGDELKGDHNSVYAGEYLVLYQRQADGSLSGTWLQAGSQAGGRETLTPKR